jgi:hypothetical protein
MGSRTSWTGSMGRCGMVAASGSAQLAGTYHRYPRGGSAGGHRRRRRWSPIGDRWAQKAPRPAGTDPRQFYGCGSADARGQRGGQARRQRCEGALVGRPGGGGGHSKFTGGRTEAPARSISDTCARAASDPASIQRGPPLPLDLQEHAWSQRPGSIIKQNKNNKVDS